MLGLTIIKKEKLRRLGLDYQTKCLEVKRLKEELKNMSDSGKVNKLPEPNRNGY